MEYIWWSWLESVRDAPAYIIALGMIALGNLALLATFILLHLIAPKPRAPSNSEKKYITTTSDGKISPPRPLPCWYDRWLAEARLAQAQSAAGKLPDEFSWPDIDNIEPAEVEMSVVVPAYNEEIRIIPALEEMVEYLDRKFGRIPGAGDEVQNRKGIPQHRLVFRKDRGVATASSRKLAAGYEIVVVNDGSRDRTVDVVLEFARKHELHDVVRVVTLEKNRGKGGSVTHGFRHVRGEYALFADADGASRFSDLDKLLEGLKDVVDGSERGVAIGSRGHLLGSEAVVKRSAVRNFLMRSFHFVLMILTPPATSRIRDTQCGFKLFSRAALPHIVPYMHAEGWIFDIEMLMLAESAPATPVLASDGSVIGTSYGIKVAEVPIAWHEVDGSKMNLAQDSVRMALGLAVLRGSWMLGVYRRRLT